MAQISLELHIFKPHIIKKGNPGTRVLSLQKPKPIRCKKPGFKPGSGTRVQSLLSALMLMRKRGGKRAFLEILVYNPSCTNDKINLCHKEDRSAGRQQQFNELPLFLTFQL